MDGGLVLRRVVAVQITEHATVITLRQCMEAAAAAAIQQNTTPAMAIIAQVIKTENIEQFAQSYIVPPEIYSNDCPGDI